MDYENTQNKVNRDSSDVERRHKSLLSVHSSLLYINHISRIMSDMMVHDLNPNALELKVGGALCVPGQPGLRSKFKDSVTWLDPVFQSQANK